MKSAVVAVILIVFILLSLMFGKVDVSSAELNISLFSDSTTGELEQK